MRLRNSTDFSDHFLRRLVSWCCRECHASPTTIKAAQFTNTTHAWSGRAWYGSRRILCRIGPPGYFDAPRDASYPNRKNTPRYTVNDRIEALVHITAHEAFHIVEYAEHRSRRQQHRNREAAVDGVALAVLEAFRANREALLAEWNTPVAVREVKRKPPIQENGQSRLRSPWPTGSENSSWHKRRSASTGERWPITTGKLLRRGNSHVPKTRND